MVLPKGCRLYGPSLNIGKVQKYRKLGLLTSLSKEAIYSADLLLIPTNLNVLKAYALHRVCGFP